MANNINFNSFFTNSQKFLQSDLGVINLFWPPAIALILVLVADLLIQQIFLPNLLKLKLNVELTELQKSLGIPLLLNFSKLILFSTSLIGAGVGAKLTINGGISQKEAFFNYGLMGFITSLSILLIYIVYKTKNIDTTSDQYPSSVRDLLFLFLGVGVLAIATGDRDLNLVDALAMLLYSTFYIVITQNWELILQKINETLKTNWKATPTSQIHETQMELYQLKTQEFNQTHLNQEFNKFFDKTKLIGTSRVILIGIITTILAFLAYNFAFRSLLFWFDNLRKYTPNIDYTILVSLIVGIPLAFNIISYYSYLTRTKNNLIASSFSFIQAFFGVLFSISLSATLLIIQNGGYRIGLRAVTQYQIWYNLFITGVCLSLFVLLFQNRLQIKNWKYISLALTILGIGITVLQILFLKSLR
jgi:hypothetical protein